MITGAEERYSGGENAASCDTLHRRRVLDGDAEMAMRPRKEESGENLRRRLIEEAEEYRRRHPVPPPKEVLEEIRRLRSSPPETIDPDIPDSTALLRESRGSLLDPSVWEDAFMDPAELRERLIEEAEAYRARYPVPPLAEVVDEIIRNGTYRPADFGAPDSVELIREDRDR
jgi:hypothetical protein